MNYFFILDGLVLLFLIICLLSGILKGFKKTWRKFIGLLIPVLFLFIFLTPITNGIMKMEVDLAAIDNIVQVIPDEYTTQSYSIDEAISLAVGSYIYPDDPTLQADSQMQQLIRSASSMIVKIVVYFIGLFFAWLFSYIVRLILRLIFGKARKNLRIVGMGVGVLRFVMYFILLLLPIFGTLSFASTLLEDLNNYQEIENESLDMINEYADLYEESITKKYVLNNATKIFCSDKTLSCDAQYVLSAFSFKINDEKVKLRDEYLTVKKALPSVLKIIEITNDLSGEEEIIIDLSLLTDEDIENISNILKNSHLIRASIPAILEYTIYSLDDETSSSKDILEQLKNVNWDSELTALGSLINVLKDHNDLKINTSNIDYIIKSEGVIDLVEDLVNGVFQVNIFTEIVLPLAIEKIEQEYTTGEYADFEIDFTRIKNINWKTEGSSFVSTSLAIYKEYLNTNINFTDFKVALNDEKLPDFVTFAFDELEKSNIVTDTLIPILMQVLIANLEKNETMTNLDIDFDALKTVEWKDNLDSIKILLHDLIISYQTLDINPEDFNSVLKNNKLQVELDKAITNILNCNVFAEYILPVVMNMAVEKLETNESLSSFEFDFAAIKNTNWKTELALFKNVIIEFLNAYQGLNFNKEEWAAILDNPNLANYITNIYNECKKTSLINEQVLPKLPNKIHLLVNNLESQIDLSFLNDIITTDSIDILLTTDINNLITLLKEIKKLGLFDNSSLNLEDANTQDALIRMIKQIFDLNVVEGKEKDLFKSVINIINIEQLLADYEITLEYENVENWGNEVDNICTMFKNLMSLTGGLDGFNFTEFFTKTHSEDEKQLIAEVVASIGNSDIFGDSIYVIVDKISKEIDPSCEISLTNEEKQIIENVNGWEYEALHILNLIEKIEHIDFGEQYENLNAEEMKEIMIYCSESVVCTKVFGTILNNVFDGVVHEDFTNQKVMKDSADIVYNAIKVASIMNDSSIDLTNPEVTNELITSIENIVTSDEHLELANQLVNNIVGNEIPVEYTKDDINDAAEVVENILSVYQNSPDQDNFSLDDLSEEDKEKIENSDIAKAILEALFK